jgi:NAD(P)-dependent dehydrogenase (short-subunit alcohol dehydrogenase family)
MSNQGVIVTGAAAGLGRAIAARLGRDGYRVAVTDIDADGAKRVADEIGDAGGRAESWRLDVADPAAVETTVAAIAERFGGLYGLVNNAGVGRATPFLEMRVEDWDWVQAINPRTWVAAQFTGGRPLATVVYEPVEEWITGMGVAASARLVPAF